MWDFRYWRVCGTGIAGRTQLGRDRLFMDNNNPASDEFRNPVDKQPYERPSFRYERVFVTTALSCGKISSTQLSCSGGNTKVS